VRRNTTIVRCDGDCKTVVEIDEKQASTEGWYQIKVARDNGAFDVHPFDFCSLKCIRRWAHARMQVVTEHSTGSFTTQRAGYEKHPCPACQEMFSPQGFFQHWTSMHNDVMPYTEARELFGKEEEEVTT
jgi:hypothetical protein